MLGKEMDSNFVTWLWTKTALFAKAVAGNAVTSHRGALMTGVPTRLKRWCKIFACILKPGLWNVSAPFQVTPINLDFVKGQEKLGKPVKSILHARERVV
jgi:hypothetical protein